MIGIPHPSHGEVPRAYVVNKKGTSLKPKEIEEFVEKQVVNYKRLIGGVKIVDDIPKNSTGKNLRRELKKMYEQTGF